MVHLVATTPILSALEAIPQSVRGDLNIPETISLGNPITHEQIIRISRYFRDKSDSDAGTDRSYDLDSLLRGTKLYIPPPPPKPEPSPEYLALKARLLAAAESDAYNRMLHPNTSNLAANSNSNTPDIFTTSTPSLAALHDTKSSNWDADTGADADYRDPLTPSLVLNIFLSILITGFSVYFALTSFQTPEALISTISSAWSWSRPSGHAGGRRPSLHNKGGGGGGASEPVRVLLSIFVALAVGVAEVVIYAIYLGKIEKAREGEKKLKERKSVIGREEVRARPRVSEDSVPVPVGKNEEVIWGRGPNGGVRRRVREKWEGAKNGDEGEDQGDGKFDRAC
ncbi:TMEM199/VMA12 family protein [Aspergillus lucknowensis]|uniref:Endoplasmic reticulum-based factor for assembly of V-ATPase-domain-containing protein n=1 Tax=Aspergillus lucknowensis TaxID=176173 RepID=A0ABR4LVV5_9EURO